MSIGPIAPYVLIISNVYGLVKTAKRVYNSTSVVGALKQAGNGIILDCTPPHIKYPAKCLVLFANIGMAVATGSPFAIAIAIAATDFFLDSD